MPSPEIEALAIRGWVAGEHSGVAADDQRAALGYGGFGTLTPPAGTPAQFPLGEVVLTPAAMTLLGWGAAIDAEAAMGAVERFVAGDWGNASAEERVVNARHLAEGDGRLVGRYDVGGGRNLTLISEFDRSLTVIASGGEG